MLQQKVDVRGAKEIAQKGMELIYSKKVRNHKLANSARIHTGEVEQEQYRIFRDFLPTWNACMVYDLVGSDNIE